MSADFLDDADGPPLGLRQPLVSIVVTTYNAGQFVQATLESVAAQTYPFFECIIVDDCSKDDTVDIIERFMEERRGEQFSFVRHDKNLGQLAAQITGFKSSRGAFVTFLDADDLLAPGYLKLQVRGHLLIEPIVAMTCTDGCMIDRDGGLLAAHHWERREFLMPWYRPKPYLQVVDLDGPVDCLIYPPAPSNNISVYWAEITPWLWTSQSFMMFRRDFLTLVMPDETLLFRSCADFYLARMAHAFNSTAVIKHSGGAYRLHGGNSYAQNLLISANQFTGDKAKHAWQSADLQVTAAEVLSQRYETFFSFYGEFRVVRALLGLSAFPSYRIYQILRQRMGWFGALAHLSIARASWIVSLVRSGWNLICRVIWAGA